MTTRNASSKTLNANETSQLFRELFPGGFANEISGSTFCFRIGTEKIMLNKTQIIRYLLISICGSTLAAVAFLHGSGVWANASGLSSSSESILGPTPTPTPINPPPPTQTPTPVPTVTPTPTPGPCGPGLLDPSFGTWGAVTTHMGNWDDIYEIALQTDGKIVAVGRRNYSSDTAVARYNTDGTLDTSFGSGGKIVMQIGDSTDYATSVAIQPDGRIVTAGISHGGGSFKFTLTRLDTNGMLDPSFGVGGIVLTQMGNSSRVESVVIQPDGKIVAVGFSHSGNSDFAVARYDSNGSLDATFGTGGRVITPVGSGSDHAYSAVLQPDGRIVVAGNSFPALSLVRYNSDGTLDNSFGTGGKVIMTIGCQVGARSVALQHDGKILAGGSTGNCSANHFDFVLTRYLADGSLDSSFGTGGIATDIRSESSSISDIAIQRDGKILAVGYANSRIAVARYKHHGKLDESFGPGGRVITSVGSSGGASACAIQSNGRIVVGGSAYEGTNENDFMVARYFADACSSPFDYDYDGRTDVSVFRPSDGTWYLQRTIAGFSGMQFGSATDKIVPADYDGDGKTDIAVFRPSDQYWYIVNSSDGTHRTEVFGLADDLPAPADYDGDGNADVCVFRPSDGTWYVQRSSDGTFMAYQFGAASDKPTVGDFDGDGKSDFAVFRTTNGEWYQHHSSDGSFRGEQFGLLTDKLAYADYDGDGRTDLAVFRPSTGIFYIRNSAKPTFSSFVFGLPEDIPTPGDYDGDGKSDISVFRPSDGNWYRLNSSNGSFNAFHFGLSGDRPTPTAFQ